MEKLDRLHPSTRAMFGCYGVYAGGKILLALRKKEDHPLDNGVWLATSPEHHSSLLKDLPAMRSIGLFGAKTTSWQVLPFDTSNFEEMVMRACELILKGDVRIGKVPKAKSVKKRNKASSRKPQVS